MSVPTYREPGQHAYEGLGSDHEADAWTVYDEDAAAMADALRGAGRGRPPSADFERAIASAREEREALGPVLAKASRCPSCDSERVYIQPTDGIAMLAGRCFACAFRWREREGS